MNKGIKIAGGVIVGVVALAVIVPMFINLNNYKGMIAEKAKAATGRDLTIDGNISLSILPMPAVSISGVKFGNAPGASQPDMVTLESAKVKVALLPLLSGNVEVKEVVLTKPVILLEKLKDGTANWQIKPAGEAAQSTAPANAGEGAKSSGMNVAVDGATIEDGVLIYRDDTTGSEQKVENINVDLAMDSLQGPFTASGGVTALGAPLGFKVALGKMDQAAPMPVDVSLSVSDAGATIGFNGTADLAAASDPQRPIVTGKLSGKGDSVAKLLAALSGGDKTAAAPALAQPFSLDGAVSAGSATATVKDLTLQLGDLTAKAGVAANYAKEVAVQANVAVGRVDLDKLMPAGGASSKPAEAAKPADQAAPAAAGGTFSLPGGITAGVDATVQQIVYQGQAIENTKLSAQLASGQLTLKSLTAQLPGASGLGASGVLYADQGQPAFTGGLKVSSGNLRALIDAFAKGAVDSVPGDRLRQMALSSKIGFKNQQLDLTELTAQLDQSTIQGGASVALPDGKQRKQMGFGVGLNIDKLNLDGYLPQGKAAGKAASNDNTKPANQPATDNKAAGGNPLKALAPLADLNANIEARIGSLTMNQQQISGLHALIGIGGGAIDIKDLSVKDFLGGHGAVTGKVTDLKGNPRFDTDFDVTAKDAGNVLQMAGMGQQQPGQFGALTLNGKAGGNGEDVTYDVNLGMAGIGATGKLNGKVSGLSGASPQVDTQLNLTAQKSGPLLRLAGLAGPNANAAGALGVGGTLKGGADKMALDLKMQALGGTAALTGTIEAKAKPIAFDISLTANHPEFSNLLRLADLPGSGVQAGPLKVAVKADGTTQKAKVSTLSAAWGDSSLNGTATYDATGARPMVVADLTGGTVNLAPFMGGSNAKSAPAGSTPSSGGSGAGGEAWSTEPLDLSALDKQDADIGFKAKSVIMPNQRIDNLVAKITLKDGLMTLQTLNGNIYGGGFNLSGTTVNGRGTPKVDAKVVVDKIQAGQVMGGGIAGNQVKGPISLNLNATGAGKSQAELVRSLSGKGNLDGTLMIIGKAEQQVGTALLNVLGQKVKQVQGISNTITGVLSNFMGVDNALKGSFNIAKGVLDTQDFTFTNPKARGAAKGQVDINTMAFSKMVVDLFTGNTDKAFMTVTLNGPLSSPHPTFSGGGGNATGGAGGLLDMLQGGGAPAGNTDATIGTNGAGTTGTGTTETAPATKQKKPTIKVPGLGKIQIP